MKQGQSVVLAVFAAIALTASANADTQPIKVVVKKSTMTETRTKAVAHDSQAAMQKEAKISMDQARATALKKAPGTVTSSELEREHGKLIYSFDIKTSKSGVTEVNVDAITGAVIAVQHENAAKEAAEKKQEAKEKKDAAKH